MVTTLKSFQYCIDAIQSEARYLVHKGVLSRYQPIYSLCKYIPVREWTEVECELERHDYLLRDPIIDLLGREDWTED